MVRRGSNNTLDVKYEKEKKKHQTIQTQQPRNTAQLLLMALQALQFPTLNRKVCLANEERGIQHLTR